MPNDPDGSSIIIGHNRNITEINNRNDVAYNITNTNLNLVQNYEGGGNNGDASGNRDNSHLLFFNKNLTDSNTNNIYNVGRMYFDETNLGVGIGVLNYLVPGPRQGTRPDFGRRNTAFGQLALSAYIIDTKGEQNNDNNYTDGRNHGTDNTGIGYGSITSNNDDFFVDLTPKQTYEITQGTLKYFGNDRTMNFTFGHPAGSGNTGVGSFALTHNGIGSYNTAVGRSALYNHSNQTDVFSNANTAVGFDAMSGKDANSPNKVHDILSNSEDGNDGHTIFGAGSLNTALGAFALTHANHATANVAIGSMAMHNFLGSDNQNDFGNIAVGSQALGNLQYGVKNIAIGYEAGKQFICADSSIAIGYQALNQYGPQCSDSDHGYNIAIGEEAAKELSSGNYNVVIGNQTLKNESGSQIISSEKNVIIGSNSVKNVTTINNSVIIGSNVTVPDSLKSGDSAKGRLFLLGSDGAQDKLLFSGIIPDGTSDGGYLNIHAGQVGFADNAYIGIKVNGTKPDDSHAWLDNDNNKHGELHVGNRVIVGYAGTLGGSDDYSLYVKNNSAVIEKNLTVNKSIVAGNSNFKVDSLGNVEIKGNLTVSGTLTAGRKTIISSDGNLGEIFSHSHSYSDCSDSGCKPKTTGSSYSDARLKNIGSDSVAGLKEINALEVKNFTFKKDEKKTPHVGVIAQQLQKIFPNAVTKDEEGYLLIRTEDIFYAMVNSIKELFKDLQNLTAKVTGLDKRIETLEKQNKQLTEQNKKFEERLKRLEKKI